MMPAPASATPTEGLKSSLVELRNAFWAVTVLLAVLIAPYRTAGYPETPWPWANQTNPSSWNGVFWIRPSSGSRVTVVPGWRTRRGGATNGELATAWAVRVVPAMPELAIRYSW